MIAVTIALTILIGIAVYDVQKYHFNEFKLSSNRETKREHKIHTIQSVIIPILIYLLYVKNSSGWQLWLAMPIVALSIIVTLMDTDEETRSRVKFGGVPSIEYQIHLMMELLKGFILAAILYQKPDYAWNLNSPELPEFPLYHQIVAGIAFLITLTGIYSHFTEPKPTNTQT